MIEQLGNVAHRSKDKGALSVRVTRSTVGRDSRREGERAGGTPVERLPNITTEDDLHETLDAYKRRCFGHCCPRHGAGSRSDGTAAAARRSARCPDAAASAKRYERAANAAERPDAARRSQRRWNGKRATAQWWNDGTDAAGTSRSAGWRSTHARRSSARAEDRLSDVQQDCDGQLYEPIGSAENEA